MIGRVMTEKGKKKATKRWPLTYFTELKSALKPSKS